MEAKIAYGFTLVCAFLMQFLISGPVWKCLVAALLIVAVHISTELLTRRAIKRP